MEKNQGKRFKNLFRTGVILIGVSLIILYISGLTTQDENYLFEKQGVFLYNYIISIIYFFFFFFNDRPAFKLRSKNKKEFTVVLILFSISAFSLNNGFQIFAELETWVTINLFLFYTALMGLMFIEKMNPYLKGLNYFFLGGGLPLIFYFAAYLVPTYHIAVIGAFVFGFSLHLLVPLMVLASSLFLFIKQQKTKWDKIAFYAGVLFPLIFVALFLFKWESFKKDIHTANATLITNTKTELPNWIILSQIIPDDMFSRKIIEGELVHDTFKRMWRNNFGFSSFGEKKIHDPLVNVAMQILGDVNISEANRVRILKSQYDARHLGQRKLWSGKDLFVVEVLNNIKLFPDYRLAYSEKIITIKSHNKFRQKEAAFTFHLPEGSVATSLSLWINGKEEKSHLTSKSKADSAYVQIVGVEKRDPALLHWQEGNCLTVTIFPCTAKEDRKFKIGITTPLEKEGKQLKYKGIYFEGPQVKGCLETTVLNFESEAEIKITDLPTSYEEQPDGRFIYTGNFVPYREILLNTTPLSSKPFAFGGKSYRLKTLKKQSVKFAPQTIYLDVNKSWTEQEFTELSQYNPEKKVLVYANKFIQINDKNRAKMYKMLTKRNFSLFPVSKISSPENALLISKSPPLSPNLSDLEGSQFLKTLKKGILKSESRINHFCIEGQLSPFLKTLKELQLFNYQEGSIEEVQTLIENKTFVQEHNNTNRVDLDIAQTSIFRDSIAVKSVAPDHLLRLFGYNKIMKEYGKNYFSTKQDYIEKLVTTANEAYVVSPVSSLIVLETKADYDRFDIPENPNSLKNASIKSAGAVPEPEEWLLIALLIATILFLYFKNKKAKKTGRLF